MKLKIIEKLKSRSVGLTVLFLAILFFGIFLRLWQLDYSSYWLDEGFTLMQSRGIVEHGYPLFDSGVVEWKDLLVPYLTAPLVKAFGFEQPWILRLSSAIFGIASIIVGYLLARTLFSGSRSVKNKNEEDNTEGLFPAMLVAFFVATCHWYVAWSQQVRGYSALIFFVLLFFYFLAKHDKNEKVRFIGYAFISIIFAVLAKKFAVVLFVSFLFYLLGKKMYKIFLFFSIPSVVMIIYFVSSVQEVLLVNEGTYFYFYIKEYLFNYFGIVAVLAWFGMVAMLLNRPRQRILNISIVLFVVSSIIIFSLFIFVSEGRYLLMITPFLFLYSAYFIEYIAKSFKRKVLVGVVLAGVVIIFSGAFNQNIVLIPKKHYALEKGTPQPNYKELYSEVMKANFTDSDVVISTNPLMDIIYLGQADYAIPWSLTGREGDITFRDNQEIYSGAKRLRGRDGKIGLAKIRKLQKESNVYVIIDSLAYRRMNGKLRKDIVQNGEKIFATKGEYSVAAFLFPLIGEGGSEYEKE
jgi:hypothetical protein